MAESAKYSRPNAVLSMKQLTRLLHIHKQTIYRVIEAGEIPAFGMGGQCRFLRSSIEKWI
jgi:excisionase family DNA binding protein